MDLFDLIYLCAAVPVGLLVAVWWVHYGGDEVSPFSVGLFAIGGALFWPIPVLLVLVWALGWAISWAVDR